MQTAITIALSAGLTVLSVGIALLALSGPAVFTYLLLRGLMARLAGGSRT